MTWTKLGDDFTDRPQMFEVSRSARLVLVECYVWSNRMLTDGRIAANVLRRISDSDNLDAEVDELVAAGLLDQADDGVQLDWTDQEPAEAVERRRQDHRDRQQRYEDRKARHARGDHSACDRRYCPKSDASGDASLTASMTASMTAPRPDPSRPVPSRRDRGQGQGGAGARSAGAPRPPRLQVGVEPFADPTPWDVQVCFTDPDDTDDPGHAEVTAQPILDRADADDFTVAHLDAGDNHFRACARTVAADLTGVVADLQARHRCHGQTDAIGMPAECGVSTDYLDSANPVIIFNVPEPLADAWLDRIADAFGAVLQVETAA